ncbi:SRPBCC family protein [Quadrisphaera sp. DSM 44207]|uniref:SRPBCC family protein n=1 Tax=Quadrisphaera sp. DSM 44207 TaxID=1881057 RepID=UPI00088AFA70|nr:SRPBCC family protein [Quadrisphaera sp. DSM 44207]SDQ18744.1 Polyketide cyclase / dehydrase and lipid transport [Quadrisphaera sp. DSM 44207]
MLTRRRSVPAPPAAVWSVLADGWTYPTFVVGASRMRDVDPGWPAPGTRLHHSAGVWPLVIDDTTSSVVAEPERRLELVARGWPAGEATVVFELEPQDGGTLVSLSEDARSGPGLLVPRPLRELALLPRNDETLRRLDHLARGRARQLPPPARG